MTEKRKLPENAQEEPHVMSPGELAEHDQQKLERSIEEERTGKRYDADAPDDPIRDPGEPSSPPPDIPSSQR
jgi:hypothetical protein